MKKKDDELSEDDLKNVDGGIDDIKGESTEQDQGLAKIELANLTAAGYWFAHSLAVDREAGAAPKADPNY